VIYTTDSDFDREFGCNRLDPDEPKGESKSGAVIAPELQL